MLNRQNERSCLNTTADILNSLKEGSDSGSMIFCMAAFVSVLLLKKELEEDLASASPAVRYGIFAVLCLFVMGFAAQAYKKATRERQESKIKDEENHKLTVRVQDLETKVATLEAAQLHLHQTHYKPPIPALVNIDEQKGLLSSNADSLSTPLLRAP